MIINGDCIEEMQKLIDDGKQVDSVVTDPPYHLTSIVERFGKEGSAPAKDKDGAFQRQSVGFMGKEWDGGDIAFRPDTWKLAYDLLKPGGHLLAFSASRNYHRMAVAIEDAGFEIRDQIMWIYGSGFPKSLNLGDGWGTALKPAHEPIVMAKKRLEGTNKQNKDKYGTGGINIDECRIEGEVKRPDTNPDFRDVAKKAMAQGGQDKLNFNQITGAKRKTTVRKSRSGDGVWTNENSGMKAEGTEFADADPRGRFPANVMHDGLDTEWSRYFYCPKASKSERNNSAVKNNHPTVKPQQLMQYLCRMVTPKGGTVLDMFMGSGSTGMAAKDEGFDFIGIEKEKEYFKIAEARIESVEIKATLQEFME